MRRDTGKGSALTRLRTLPRRAWRLANHLVRRMLFPVLERLVPADDRYWCFCTWDRHYHTLDNPRAVLEAIRADRSIVPVVLQKRPSETGAEREWPGVRFVPAESWRGAYYLARSRVLLLGYALRAVSSYASRVTPKHLIVQLWHGIPLRRVGRMFPREEWWAAETPKYAAMVASTERERDNLAQAFAPLDRERIWLTGLPRNDFFLGEESVLPADYLACLEELRGALDGRRLVLYAPTWRDHAEDHYVFSADERVRLGALLRRHGAVLGVRGHSNVRNLPQYAEGPAEPEFLLLNHIPDVNVILRETAVLITDYSSIYLDFLLTDRPILHFTYDLEAYLQKRIGFLYELEEALAGPPLRDTEELLVHLERALAEGVADRERYQRVRDLFHRHGPDSGAQVADRIRALARDLQPAAD